MSANQKISRDNHYVPQWYQKGFLAKGRHKLYVLNLHPASTTLPSAPIIILEPELEEQGTKQAFMEIDLYTTRLGGKLNDDIETFLFGEIDRTGANAVRSWITGDAIKIHHGFQDFFGYMDGQKLRTPKGLDWILKHFKDLPQVALMEQMQQLRQMHCTMWSECVREIVSAVKSPVKFLVSDHPVTTYHSQMSPDAADCQYPGDPGIELIGSQTVFALDANHCLILTNLEYAENPENAALLSRRTNARFRGGSMARTDAMIRSRELSEAEVHAINLVLKSRARKYVASSNPAWLYPEQHCHLPWEGIAKILLPGKDLFRFGGEIYIGYKDGTSAYRDKFGRTSKAHEFVAKPPREKDPAPSDACGCGSGLAFSDCCMDVAPQRRPSWSVRSIRERNLFLIRGINKILGLEGEQKTWLEVRRNLSNNQVSDIHKLYAALWPTDTQLVDLLPRPQKKRSRALYLGMMDARTLSTTVTGMLAYLDELVLVHPFANANSAPPDLNPIHRPEQFRDQTLRSVFMLLILEAGISAGRIHLVPDPLDYDAGFRSEIKAITSRPGDRVKTGPIDAALNRTLGHDDYMLAIKRLPKDELKAYIQRQVPADAKPLTEDDLDSLVSRWKSDIEEDPLALLDPLPTSEDGGEYKVMRGFCRETGLYVATLTGSIVYTCSDTQWERLHQFDGVHRYEPDPVAGEFVRCLDNVRIAVAPTLADQNEVEPPGASETRALLRQVAVALRSGAVLGMDAQAVIALARPPEEEEGLLTYKLQPSTPLNGFQRTDVARLVLTFGRVEDVVPVQLALFLESVTPSGR